MPNSSVPEACGQGMNGSGVAVGSLATGLGMALGVVSGVMGTGRALLVNLLTAPALMAVSMSSQEWSFEEGECWFELQENLRFNQSSIVRHIFIIFLKQIFLFDK